MHEVRRKDKAILDGTIIKDIIKEAKYVTVALSLNDEPYLVTLSHGFDEENNCLHFHCARAGRKLDIIKINPRVWGQALVDNGYQQGSCDHLYQTAQFHGKATFVTDLSEKKRALGLLIKHLDNNPEIVEQKQVTLHSVDSVLIGRIDIDFLSGKKADKTIIQA